MNEQFDYIVVGAGPAGCALAAKLADAPDRPRVALIETGPRRAGLLSDLPIGLAAIVRSRGRINYGYETVPQPHLGGRKGYQPRGRGLGGSSLINAMVHIRGQAEDYEDWAIPGWGWTDLRPYFDRLPLPAAALRLPCPTAADFIEAAAGLGLARNTDFNGAEQEGVGFYRVFQQDGRRRNAAAAYLGVDRPNLTIVTDSQVRKILIEDKRAVGVATGRRTLAARREIVLCAGAFGSPQLLMLSGIGDGAHLSAHGIPLVHHLPSVGRNLQDHLDYTANVAAPAPGTIGIGPGLLLEAAREFGAWRKNGRGFLTTNISEAGGFVRSSPSVARPDLQFHFCIAIVDRHGKRLHRRAGYALHVCALRPKSRGSVTLRSADPAAAPLIDPNYLSHPDDLALTIEGARLVHRILAQEPLSRHGGTPLYAPRDLGDEALTEIIRARADTIYHPAGTCRMGRDADSVVDPTLKVRGIDGLRVADASIMPALVSGNTEAPSAAIGEKAADLILTPPSR
jgi:choline dehydrogenase-like flavoprotein